MAEAAARYAADAESRRERERALRAAADAAAAAKHAEATMEEYAREERRRERERLRRQQHKQDTLAADSPEPVPAASTLLEVVVPSGYKAGDTLDVALEDGGSFEVVIPPGLEPGATFCVEPPADEIDEEEIPSGIERQLVTVPDGVAPGDTFHVSTSWGAVFEVACPAGVLPGDSIEVELPAEPDPEYPDLAARPAQQQHQQQHRQHHQHMLQEQQEQQQEEEKDQQQQPATHGGEPARVRPPGRLPSINSPSGGSPANSSDEDDEVVLKAERHALLLERTELKLRSQAIIDSAVQLGRAAEDVKVVQDADAARAIVNGAVAVALAALAVNGPWEPARTTDGATPMGPAAGGYSIRQADGVGYPVGWSEVTPISSGLRSFWSSEATPLEQGTPLRAGEPAECTLASTSPSRGVVLGVGARLSDRFGARGGGGRQQQGFSGAAASVCGGIEFLTCRSTALREPTADEGCRFYVGQAVQVLRTSGAWGEATILEILHGFETMYRCRLGEGVLEKHMGEDEVRELQPENGFVFCKGQTVQICRPDGALELATILETRMDRANVRSEPWYSCKLHPSESQPYPRTEQIHEDELQLPQAQAGCAFFVGQLVQAQRRKGEWVLARVVEFALKDYELQYKCAVVRDAVVESWEPHA